MNSLPNNHQERINRSLQSLEGLSVGDAFGQCFFIPESQALSRIEERLLPEQPWYFTDDTIMSLSVVECLNKFGYVNQEYLARRFAERYYQQPDRGYGGTAHKILRDIYSGRPWQEAAQDVFSGMGSMGNGAAMRVGPIGAYFQGDYKQIVTESIASAKVTHSHDEAHAGAVAVAIAAGYCSQQCSLDKAEFLDIVLTYTPDSTTASRIRRCLNFSSKTPLTTIVSRLGNGEKLCAYDTVPISIWFASEYLNNYCEGIWNTVSALGDRDTTCAIVGSIIALSDKSEIPEYWLAARENLPIHGLDL